MSRFVLTRRSPSHGFSKTRTTRSRARRCRNSRPSSPWCLSSGIWRCATCWSARNGADAWAPRGSRTVLRQLGELPIRTDTEPNLETALALARRHRLTIYDALYLELALRAGVPLATVDLALADAAVAEGRSLIGPLPELG